MTANLLWPEWILTPSSITPLHVIPTNTSGGRSPTGGEQIVGNSPGRNRVVLQGVQVRTPEQERIYRTIALTLGGRSGAIMVPAFGRRTAPWPTVGGERLTSASPVALTDSVLFSNGAGFYTRTILATAYSAVVPGAVTMQVQLVQGSSVKIGHIFQAGECAYTAIKITAANEALGIFSVNFWPPARVAIAAGDDLDFDNPRFRARLEADDGMSLDLEMWRFGSPSVAFVEDC